MVRRGRLRLCMVGGSVPWFFAVCGGGMWGTLRCIVGCWYFEYVKERKEILSKDVWELFVKE